jgi:hypothetical protein
VRQGISSARRTVFASAADGRRKRKPGWQPGPWSKSDIPLLVVTSYRGDEMPSTGKGWLSWACYTLESQSSPFSTRYDGTSRTDPRLRSSRETAISVIKMLEQASTRYTRNGVGVELLAALHVREASWYCFTDEEKAIIRKVERDFRCRLCTEDFLLPCGRQRQGRGRFGGEKNRRPSAVNRIIIDLKFRNSVPIKLDRE